MYPHKKKDAPMNIDLLNTLTPEQREIVKKAWAEEIQRAMNDRGVKAPSNSVIPKYAFLKQKHIKRIKFIKIAELKNGKRVVFRVFK